MVDNWRDVFYFSRVSFACVRQLHWRLLMMLLINRVYLHIVWPNQRVCVCVH